MFPPDQLRVCFRRAPVGDHGGQRAAVEPVRARRGEGEGEGHPGDRQDEGRAGSGRALHDLLPGRVREQSVVVGLVGSLVLFAHFRSTFWNEFCCSFGSRFAWLVVGSVALLDHFWNEFCCFFGLVGSIAHFRNTFWGRLLLVRRSLKLRRNESCRHTEIIVEKPCGCVCI